MSAAPRGTDSAKVIRVVETRALRGSGDSAEDICRIVTQYWSLDGKLLAEHDDWVESHPYIPVWEDK